jgi:aryl-alcohol dehydrogenase-like predicted oxidoreductase
MKLALGTVQFGLDYGVANVGGQPDFQNALSVVSLSRELGMDTLDTAIAYGDSESLLGRLGVQDWRVVSKLPAVPENCSDISCWVKQQVQDSLSRLRVSTLYGLLLHRPSQLLEEIGPALFDAISTLKADGLVSKIGVSVYGSNELDKLFEKYQFDLIQSPLNILDRSLIDSGWAKRLKVAGVEVHTRSVFLQGLLLMPSWQRPVKFNRWHFIWQEWSRWLTENGLSPLQGCIRYAVAHECIDRVIVGVDSATQLGEINSAMHGELLSLPDFNPLEDARLINPSDWNLL